MRNSLGKRGKSEKNRKFATYFAVVSIDAGKWIEIKLNQNNKNNAKQRLD
jgi:phosphoribosylformylglycinamidine (FGAM) synthase PurS component